MAFFAIVQRGDALIPIVKGGDGPDSDCLATWPSHAEAYNEASAVPISNYGAIMIFDTEDES